MGEELQTAGKIWEVDSNVFYVHPDPSRNNPNLDEHIIFQIGASTTN